MAVAHRFHPGCEEAKGIQAYHTKEMGLVKDLPGTRLFAIFEERRIRAFVEHEEECVKCWTFMRTCQDCGVDLTMSAHRFRCVQNPKRWRKLFSTRAPPRAHEARHRPAPLETPPPPRAPEPAPPAPAPRGAPKPATAPAAKSSAPKPSAAKPAAPNAPVHAGKASGPASAPPKAQPAAPKPKPAAKPSPFEVLGIKPDATVSAIRAAYRDKAMEYHPDRVASLAPEFQKLAEQRMRAINEAYEALLRMAAKPR